MRKSIIVFWVFIVSLCKAEPLQVVTFNIGGAQAVHFETVPCRRARLVVQPDAIFHRLRKPFVLMLQEVLGKDAEKEYRDYAKLHGLYVAPKNRDVGWEGTLTFSSEPIRASEFHPFSVDTYIMKRGVLETVISYHQKKLHVFNTHTSFGSPKRPSGIHIQQLYEISQIVNSKSENVILGGDVNMGANVSFNRGHRKQNYDPVAVIWNPFISWLNPHLEEQQLPEGKYSRDEIDNPVLKEGVWFVKLNRGWHMNKQATIDHIFVSRDLSPSGEAQLIFNNHLFIPGCPSDDQGLSVLSDHYGVETFLDI